MHTLRQSHASLSQTTHAETVHGRHTQSTVEVYRAPNLTKRWDNAGLCSIVWVIRQGVRDGLHWVKDVTLQEDDPPRRSGFAPISWAIFNSFLITLVRRLGSRTVPDGIRELANQVHEVFRWLT